MQAPLGHFTSEIRREVYLHSVPEDQRQTVARVESLAFGLNRTQIDWDGGQSWVYPAFAFVPV